MDEEVRGPVKPEKKYTRRGFMKAAGIFGTAVLAVSLGCTPEILATINATPTPTPGLVQPSITPIDALPTSIPQLTIPPVTKTPLSTQEAKSTATEVPKSFEKRTISLESLAASGKEYIDKLGNGLELPQLRPVESEKYNGATLKVSQLIDYTFVDWGLSFPDGYDGPDWFVRNPEKATEFLKNPENVLKMRLSTMNYRGIDGGIGWEKTSQGPLFFRGLLKSQSPLELKDSEPAGQTLHIKAPVTIIGSLPDGRIALAFKETLEGAVRPPKMRTAIVTAKELKDNLIGTGGLTFVYDDKNKKITFGDYTLGLNQIDGDVAKLITPPTALWIDHYIDTDKNQQFYLNPEVRPYPPALLPPKVSEADVLYQMVEDNQKTQGVDSKRAYAFIKNPDTGAAQTLIDIADYDPKSNEWVWRLVVIEKTDINNIETWPKEMRQYWTDLGSRPNDPEAADEVQKQYEKLDDEFTNKYWVKITEAFLAKEGIDVSKFNFGRELDRPTMLTWGMIKWQQDHLQDYLNGKVTLENWLLKIPPSVIRHLVQDQYNYTVSYQEKIEGIRSPKVHDGILVKYNKTYDEAIKSILDYTHNTEKARFPIFGADLIGKSWPPFINSKYIGDLSGLFLIPGKDPTEQIGALSGNEGQPDKGVGLFPFTVAFKDRTETYRFLYDGTFSWKKLTSPVTVEASHPYDGWDREKKKYIPVKIENIIASLGGKVIVNSSDSIQSATGEYVSYIISGQYGLANADGFDTIIPDLNHPELTEVMKKYYSPANQPWKTEGSTTTSATSTPTP